MQASPSSQKRIRERETPQPSVVWQTLAITFTSFAFAAALAALTISDAAAVGPSELWVAAAGLLLAAALSFAAHRDVNRGRRSKWVEVEELPATEADN